MLGGRTRAEALEREWEALFTARGLRVARFSFAQAQDRAELARLPKAYGIPRYPGRPAAAS